MAPPSLITISASTRRTTGFFCPVCGGDRTAIVRQGRRWVRVGPLAVLPWRGSDDRATCCSCRSDHPAAALDVLTSAALALVLTEVRVALTAMTVRTGGATDPALRRRAVQMVRTVRPAYTQNDLDRDMARLDPAEVAALVEPLDDAMVAEGKEALVADMVKVALAAHTITGHQRWLLEAAGQGLGLTPLHVTGIISGVAAAVEPAADDPADRP
ncbi:hypothetical protein [Aquihabitans sp. McL0605]|uniref:hypothetical protein n=1 Tax=Aquihabitans sp. McL0605 TaxID=3415671 RepID=UPI003CEE432E